MWMNMIKSKYILYEYTTTDFSTFDRASKEASDMLMPDIWTKFLNIPNNTTTKIKIYNFLKS